MYCTKIFWLTLKLCLILEEFLEQNFCISVSKNSFVNEPSDKFFFPLIFDKSLSEINQNFQMHLRFLPSWRSTQPWRKRERNAGLQQKMGIENQFLNTYLRHCPRPTWLYMRKRYLACFCGTPIKTLIKKKNRICFKQPRPKCAGTANQSNLWDFILWTNKIAKSSRSK